LSEIGQDLSKALKLKDIFGLGSFEQKFIAAQEKSLAFCWACEQNIPCSHRNGAGNSSKTSSFGGT
jgi:hypothetical protein